MMRGRFGRSRGRRLSIARNPRFGCIASCRFGCASAGWTHRPAWSTIDSRPDECSVGFPVRRPKDARWREARSGACELTCASPKQRNQYPSMNGTSGGRVQPVAYCGCSACVPRLEIGIRMQSGPASVRSNQPSDHGVQQEARSLILFSEAPTFSANRYLPAPNGAMDAVPEDHADVFAVSREVHWFTRLERRR
jgi:hypothetical protein